MLLVCAKLPENQPAIVATLAAMPKDMSLSPHSHAGICRPFRCRLCSRVLLPWQTFPPDVQSASHCAG